MPNKSLSFLVVATVLLTVGCGTSAEPAKSTKAAAPDNTQPQPKISTQSIPVAKNAGATISRDEAAVKDFLQRDEFCHDVLSGQSLTDFLAETLSAIKDVAQSRPGIRYAEYRDSEFTYQFLDEKLFAIRYVVPRSTESAADSIAPYRKAFGPPTDTMMPPDFRDSKASQFLSWDLPQHNLRVNFAHLPASLREADLDLFGQFINLTTAKEFLTCRARMASNSPDGNKGEASPKISVARRAIEEQIANPEWGTVAATVNRLCAAQVRDEEIHVQVLKTIKLARTGNLSPEFTLQALLQAEASAAQLRLSSVSAVQACQQSLAIAAAPADQTPQNKELRP